MRCQWEGKDGGSSLYEPREGYQMMRVEARELEGALRGREARREPVSGVEFVCVRGVQGLKGAGVLQGVRAMAARVYAGEEWYVHDDGGTGRIECLYERAKGGVGAVQFVVARLTTEDRWASNGRRAERAGAVQGRRTMGGEGGAATAGSAADGGGGSAEAGGGEEAGSDSMVTGPQGCWVARVGSSEMGCETGGGCDGGGSGREGGGGEGNDGRAGAGGGVRGEGGDRRGGSRDGERGRGPSGGEGDEGRGGTAAAGEGEGMGSGEARVGRGKKRGRGEREADSEGRQVRTRTDRRGVRKRKKGDG